MLTPGPGVRIAERYELHHKLGEGGMGSVWAAVDQKLRRDVAVKLVTERIADSARALARFEREAMAVARLRSPYIAQVYDYGVEDGSPYIIMELLEGHDLKAKLSREGRLDIIETGRVVVQACKALHAAHQAGVIHRDLKPANIFLAREGDEDVAKVFDFGVAKALNDLADDTETTAEGVLLGTPKYMSPEQAHGAREVDHRTDLWAMAVITYACLTGRLPFEGTGTGHVLVKVCTETPPAPSDLHEGVPPVVDEFFDKALAKEPSERFQDAKSFAHAFAELAEVSMSTFSLKGKLGSGVHDRPATGGAASWPSAPSHGGFGSGDVSISLDDELRGFDGSAGSPAARGGSVVGVGPGEDDDGTLGPSTRTDAAPPSAPPGSVLARPRTRQLAGLFAALSVLGLGLVVALRASGPASDGAPRGPATETAVEPDASGATTTRPGAPNDDADGQPPSGAAAATPPAPAGAPDTEAGRTPAVDPEAPAPGVGGPTTPPVSSPSVPAVDPRGGGAHAAGATSRPGRQKAAEAPKTSADEPAPGTTSPPSKKKSGDGLDLFDQRF
ncbi:MAG: protein kinase [Myxococcota bacterium]